MKKLQTTKKTAGSKIPVKRMVILRTWFKCVCTCVWYDDNDNCFSECPECGGSVWHILDDENIAI